MTRKELLLTTGNFLGGLLGGTVLALGIDLFQGVNTKIDGILPYLLGAVLTLFALPLIRRLQKFHVVSLMGALFCVALASVIALNGRSFTHSFQYLLGVSFIFATIFLSRSMRTDFVAGTGGKIAYTEFAYSLGYLAALLFPLQAVSDLHLSIIYLAGAVTMLMMGVMDRILSTSMNEYFSSVTPKNVNEPRLPRSSQFNRSEISIMLLFTGITILCQLVLQKASNVFGTTTPLMGLEIGISVAPLMYSWLLASAMSGGAGIIIGKNPSIKFSFRVMFLLSCVLVMSFLLLNNFKIVGVILAVLIALLYEFTSLGLLESLKGRAGGITMAFSINACLSTFVYWFCLMASTGFDSLALLSGLGILFGLLSLGADRLHGFFFSSQDQESDSKYHPTI